MCLIKFNCNWIWFDLSLADWHFRHWHFYIYIPLDKAVKRNVRILIEKKKGHTDTELHYFLMTKTWKLSEEAMSENEECVRGVEAGLAPFRTAGGAARWTRYQWQQTSNSGPAPSRAQQSSRIQEFNFRKEHQWAVRCPPWGRPGGLLCRRVPGESPPPAARSQQACHVLTRFDLQSNRKKSWDSEPRSRWAPLRSTASGTLMLYLYMAVISCLMWLTEEHQANLLRGLLFPMRESGSEVTDSLNAPRSKVTPRRSPKEGEKEC